MSERPKIALCYSGQPRTWRQCWPSQKSFFQEADVSVFMHLWEEDVSTDDFQDLMVAYSPEDIEIEPRPNFSNLHREIVLRFPWSPQVFTVDMAYGIKKAVQLSASSHREFDYVVRMRFDTLFQGEMNWTDLREDCLNVFDWGDPKYLQDQFAMGASSILQSYGKFYDWLCHDLDTYTPDQNRAFVAERAFMQAVKHYDLKINIMEPAPFLVLRPSMVGKAYENVRYDLGFEADKYTKIREYTKSITNESEYNCVKFNHKYADLYPYKECESSVQSYWDQPGVCLQNDFIDQSWQGRLDRIEDIIKVLILNNPKNSSCDMASYNLMRLVITLMLWKVDDELDPYGFILNVISLENFNHVKADRWLSRSENLNLYREVINEAWWQDHPLYKKLVSMSMQEIKKDCA